MHYGLKHHLKAAIVGGIHHAKKYSDGHFLYYNGDMSINFLSIIMMNFIRFDYFPGVFFDFSVELSVIYSHKNYDSPK